MGIFRPKPKVELNAVEVGTRAEMFIINRLIANGYTVLTPIGNNTRYDIVIEDADGQFWRIQCKNGRRHHRMNAIEFNNYTLTRAGKRVPYTGAQVDYLAVYFGELQKAYLVPISHLGKVRGYLRLDNRSKSWANNKELRLAEDYEI